VAGAIAEVMGLDEPIRTITSTEPVLDQRTLGSAHLEDPGGGGVTVVVLEL
jgi:hypothetical protein